jgi:hypothetical protein
MQAHRQQGGLIRLLLFFQNTETWLKKEARIETAEIKFCRSAAGYIRKEQMRNAKIREGLNVFNADKKFKIQITVEI